MDRGLRPDHEWPFVSVVIPVYNEARYIEACLRSVLDQDYPSDRVEVILADGGSTDETLQIVARVAADRAVRVIRNPRRTQAAGLNLAIKVSTGSLIARQDGHATWTRHHLRRSVELLFETGASNVGGMADGVGDGVVGRAIACAMHSPFGVGGARFRYSQRFGDADTVFPGLFQRSVFERVGLFNETYPPHEDYELNERIRAAGGRVIYTPEIPARYFVRNSRRALGRQYFAYGRAKMRVARNNWSVVRFYHLVAPALVMSFVAAPMFMRTRWGRRALTSASTLYGVACLAAGVTCSRDEPVHVRVRVPGMFPVLHICWGAGFWAGVFEALRSDAGATRAVEYLPPLQQGS